MTSGGLSPRSFTSSPSDGSPDPYLADPSIRLLAQFFCAKGLGTLKDEDAREQWYEDWIDHQAKHRLYASVLSPRQFSTLGHRFDLLKLTRFVEVFAYFSPAHGYSLQVSFLGLFSILMGDNDALKREAVAALEAGGLLALGVSERAHGSDLLSNEFAIAETAAGSNQFIANGRKFYIGNANRAAIVSILARKHPAGVVSESRQRRAPFALIAVRPPTSPAYQNVRKIRTLGIRAAYVGELEVVGHPLPASDIITEGRGAWEAVLATVTLGKFLLGFASVGICEHALAEAVDHLRRRVLYRKGVLDMPHLRLATAQAYARLAAMKLYAYRALDYVHAASESDRRYLLFCAVQKSKVSTEGVTVVAQLSECIGARGFESESYFESALRDVQLIPGLEGSTHINIGLTAQLAQRYLARRATSPIASRLTTSFEADPPAPPSLARGDIAGDENPYLMQPHGAGMNDIAFGDFRAAYRPLKHLANVRRFARQAQAFARLIRHRERDAAGGMAAAAHASSDGNGNGQAHRVTTASTRPAPSSTATATAMTGDLRITLALGQCTATIAYGQLVAENAALFNTPAALISAIFHLLVLDLSTAATTLAALPDLDRRTASLARRLVTIPRTSAGDWEAVAGEVDALRS